MNEFTFKGRVGNVCTQDTEQGIALRTAQLHGKQTAPSMECLVTGGEGKATKGTNVNNVTNISTFPHISVLIYSANLYPT